MTDGHPHPTRPNRQSSVPRVLAGRYALHGELGRGGMGIVWRAEDQVIGRAVAIKELRLPDAGEGSSVFAERVLREVRTGGRLNDPAVVTVFDVIAEDQTTYIVMELVEAPTLSQLVRERGPLPPQQAAAIGEQVLSALTAAHQAGIVHRDVKPANIMVAANGRVKLTDFGIAQAVDDPRLTTSGFLVGSPAFMAPERVSGREALPASDLWSLGATLFFAVEGTMAFERGSTAATLHAIMNEVPYLTHAQGPLASAIMGMLISTPEARISADQVAGLLAMARGGTGTPTPAGGHPTAPYSGHPGRPTVIGSRPTLTTGQGPGLTPAKRRAALIGAPLLAVVLLVVGFALGSWWAGPSAARMAETLTYGSGGDIGFDVSSSVPVCLNGQLSPGFQIDDTLRIDCEDRHAFEVYDQATGLGEGNSSDGVAAAEYPGEAGLSRFAESRCALGFESNLVNKEGRDLVYRAVIPTKAAWDSVQQDSSRLVRAVYCVVANADGSQMTGGVTTEVR
ncbi:MAG: serine/threonine-protein kinase [Haloechinothrix sp.]